MERLFTTEELAKHLKVVVGTLNNWRHEKPPRGPKWRNLQGTIRYAENDIVAWQESEAHDPKV